MVTTCRPNLRPAAERAITGYPPWLPARDCSSRHDSWATPCRILSGVPDEQVDLTGLHRLLAQQAMLPWSDERARTGPLIGDHQAVERVTSVGSAVDVVIVGPSS